MDKKHKNFIITVSMDKIDFIPYGGSSCDIILPDSDDPLADDRNGPQITKWSFKRSTNANEPDAQDQRTKAPGGMLSLDESTLKRLQRLMKNNEVIVKREPWNKVSNDSPSPFVGNTVEIKRLSRDSSEKSKDLLIRREPLELVEIVDSEDAKEDVCSETVSKIPKLNVKKGPGKRRLMDSDYTPTINCKLCKKEFRHEYSLKIHMRSHTGEKPFPCGICGKSFRQISTMKQHELIHTGAKPHVCRVCGKSFTQSSNQRKHERLHQGIKPFVCNLCGKAFIDKHGLQDHFKVHTGEKPYSCSRCDKKFAHASDVKVHMRVHTGERPYPCTLCDMRFTQSGALKMHIRTHTKEKPLQCPLCGKCYSHPTTLRYHIISHSAPKGRRDAVCVKVEPTNNEQGT